jgi:hypothetical protein
MIRLLIRTNFSRVHKAMMMAKVAFSTAKYEDLFDSHFVSAYHQREYYCDIKDGVLVYSMDSENKEDKPEWLGKAKVDDICLINLRTTSWGPMADDVFCDIYDVASGVVLSDGAPMYIPLTINLSGHINFLQDLRQYGIDVNYQKVNEAMQSVVYGNFPVYFNKQKCDGLHEELLQKASLSKMGKWREEDLIKLEEIARRAHYLFRSFFKGESNHFPDLESCPIPEKPADIVEKFTK